MDNWLFFLLGLIFAIPLGIFTNIVTPWVKAYFDKSSLSSKKKRIAALSKEYRLINSLRQNPIMFAYDMAKLVADGLYSLAFLAIVLGLDLVLIAWMLVSPSSSRQLFWDMFLVTSIWGLAVYFSVKSFQTRIRKITSFDEYEKEIMGKIRKLGGKPEDLDKEETDIVKA